MNQSVPAALKIVQIGDYKVSASPEDVLVTYALGSCIGIVIYDKVAGVGGLLHILLPYSSLDPAKAKANPAVFADTGIPLLFQRAYALGAVKQRLRVSLIGGAQFNVSCDFFNVGSENIAAARYILQRANVTIHDETVGGRSARTVRLHVGTGQISMQETDTGVQRTA